MTCIIHIVLISVFMQGGQGARKLYYRQHWWSPAEALVPSKASEYDAKCTLL